VEEGLDLDRIREIAREAEPLPEVEPDLYLKNDSGKDLSIGYRYALPIVSGISFDFPAYLPDGEALDYKKRKNILGFVGPNGAGKTTLLKTCIGLLSSLHGELCLLGTDTKSSTFAETRKNWLISHKTSLKEIRGSCVFRCERRFLLADWVSADWLVALALRIDAR